MAAISAGSRPAARRPLPPSRTTSPTPPTAVATIGRPAADASIRLTGVPSFREVRTTRSESA